MKMSKLYLVLAAVLFFASCDVIEGPYLEDHEITDPGSDPGKQNALLLDFTGHTCKSCPKAHRTIKQLVELYGERVIPVAFHLGYFARPLSGDKFTMDFRTTQGAELENFYEFVSFPVGLVGSLDKARLSSYSSWPAEVNALMENEAEVKIILNPEYIEESGIVQLKITLLNKSELQGEIRLAVYLTEDGIISWQKDEDADPVDVGDYEHNHVFRASAGSVWGETLSESDCSAGANVQFTKSIELDPSWVPENCSLVVFLYEAGSKEVIQCTTKALTN